MEDKTIHQKLIEVQEELKAPKGQYNSFGKYHFRSTEDIVEALKPLLIKRGLLLLMYDEIELVGSRIYVVSTADLTDGATNIKVSARARESETKKGMDDSQITGTASSYARKYALNGMFLIDDSKDADTPEYSGQMNNQQQSKQPKAQPKPELTPEQKVAANIDWVNKKYKPEIELIKSWQEMEHEQALKAIKEYASAMKGSENK
ncbi:MAG: ERF family protein [Lactococcus sp.]|nr:ERF family protein [Lactococcus sp.]MDN6063416.1 ERF family protein [Staphylococcus simulans]MDN5402836.1 ERF family protein [Lactococcus sp.]MDN5410102.1 ERF family protein [Lactococcus sp.]MDN5411216.1 ERF family protein [Lactococcus sp.]MDN5435788.1 ERF family protein [Lactococcus sp.]